MKVQYSSMDSFFLAKKKFYNILYIVNISS